MRTSYRIPKNTSSSLQLRAIHPIQAIDVFAFPPVTESLYLPL